MKENLGLNILIGLMITIILGCFFAVIVGVKDTGQTENIKAKSTKNAKIISIKEKSFKLKPSNKTIYHQDEQNNDIVTTDDKGNTTIIPNPIYTDQININGKYVDTDSNLKFDFQNVNHNDKKYHTATLITKVENKQYFFKRRNVTTIHLIIYANKTDLLEINKK